MSASVSFTDSEIDYWTERIEAQHPTWSVHQTYRIDGWGLQVYNEFSTVGEYHRGHVATLRRLAGMPDNTEEAA